MPMIDAERLRGVVFDMDGLIFDTENIFKEAWQAAAQDEGHDMSDELFLSIIGRVSKDSDRILKEALGEDFDLREFKRLTAIKGEEIIARRGFPLKAGVKRIMAWVKDRGLPAAVATSTNGDEARRRFNLTGLIDNFAAIISGDMVSNGKPHPEIYLEACAAIGLPPGDCLALEDSHHGVRSAHAAGLIVANVPDLIPPTDEIRQLTQGRVFRSLHAVVEALEAVDSGF